jgi:prepilin-type processing-associated H-X9-DG protein
MKPSSKHAFTLTELLVVVPVAILMGTMLFTVSNDAKQQLQAAACLNNMRQWGLGFMLYANDYQDYFPYDGQPGNPCTTINTNAWFNVVPQYIGQKTLCQLYMTIPPSPPTVFTKSVWSCPSSTNTTAQPTLNNPYFMYALNACLHEQGIIRAGFRRNRMTSPTNTILFCEEPEDNFPETNGRYDTVTRHFGGSNFVFGDGHADWVHFTNFCRAANTVGCPAPLGQLQWDQSGINGDWKSVVHYHWWPLINANTSSQ